MSTPLHAFLTDTFVSDGAAVNVTIPSDVQQFDLYNITSVGSTAATTPVMLARWVIDMPDGTAYYAQKTNGAATLQAWNTTASNGFTRIADSGASLPSAAVAVTNTSNADPIVVSTGSTAGLSTGDIVRLSGITAAQQITNFDWTIGNIVTNTSFELLYTGVAPGSVGTAGFWRRIPFDPMYYPRRRFITFISQATSAVIEMSVTHGLTVGQRVKIIVPTGWGMTEITNQYATITAISTANNTITVDIDSSGYTTFAYPTSAVALAGVSYPQVVPVGEAATSPYQNLLDDATRNTSFRGLRIGTTVQSTGETYRWVAKRGVEL